MRSAPALAKVSKEVPKQANNTGTHRYKEKPEWSKKSTAPASADGNRSVSNFVLKGPGLRVEVELLWGEVGRAVILCCSTASCLFYFVFSHCPFKSWDIHYCLFMSIGRGAAQWLWAPSHPPVYAPLAAWANIKVTATSHHQCLGNSKVKFLKTAPSSAFLKYTYEGRRLRLEAANITSLCTIKLKYKTLSRKETCLFKNLLFFWTEFQKTDVTLASLQLEKWGIHTQHLSS